MTLEELKAQNAAKEEQSTEEENQSIPEISDENIEEVEDEEPEIEDDEDDEPDSDDEDEPPVESPAWAQPDSDDDNEPTTVPLAKHIKVRSELREERNELKEEVQSLKQQLAQMQSGNQSTQQRQTPKLKRPKRSDFDYDQHDDPDAAYEEALDQYYDDRDAQREAERTSKYEQESAQKLYTTQVKTAVDSHYDRAAKLVEDKLVTAEAYQKADANIKAMFEQLHPGKGEGFANEFISRLDNLGEGSEKLYFQLGNSQKALRNLQQKITSDPTYLSAMGYVGTLYAKLNTDSSKKRISRAPKPGTKLKSDSTSNTKAAAAKKFAKQYKAAGGDIQSRLNIKMEAKAAGIDTSKW